MNHNPLTSILAHIHKKLWREKCHLYCFLVCFLFTVSLRGNESIQSEKVKILNDQSYDTSIRYFNKKLSDTQYREKKSLHEACYEYILSHPKLKNEGLKTIIQQCRHFQNLDLLIKAQEEYVLLPEIINTVEATKTYFSIGYISTHRENYGKGLFYFSKFLNEKHNIYNKNELDKVSITYKELGYIYFMIENYRQALLCYKEYLNHVKGISYYYETSVLNDIGQCYRELGNKDSAIHYFNLAIQTLASYRSTVDAKKLDDFTSYFKPIIEASSFDFFIQDRRYQEAYNLGKNEVIGGEKGCDNSARMRGNYKMLVANYHLNNRENFQINFNQFLEYYAKAPNEKLRLKAYKLKLKLDAFHNEKKLIQQDLMMIDSIEALISARDKVIRSQFVFESNMELKDEEIRSVTEKLALESTNRKYANLIIILTTLLLLGSAFVFFKLRQNNKKIHSQKNVLEKEYRKQNLLLKEIHHRVKNNLQIISSYLQLQLGKSTEESVIKSLNETNLNIQAISLVHENLYKDENIELVNLKNYISALCEGIERTMSNSHNFHFHLSIASILCPIEKTISFGLIINELIVNTFKHGYENTGNGQVSIQLKKNDSNEIEFIYFDKGKGIDLKNLNNRKSIGFRMLDMIITEDLRGQYEIKNENGFMIQINFVL